MRACLWTCALAATSGVVATKVERGDGSSCAIVVTESYGHPVWLPTAAVPDSSTLWSEWVPAAQSTATSVSKSTPLASWKSSSTKPASVSTTAFPNWGGHKGNSGLDASKISSYISAWPSRIMPSSKTTTSSLAIGQQPWSDWQQSTSAHVATTSSSSPSKGWPSQPQSSASSAHASSTWGPGHTDRTSSSTATHLSSTVPHSWTHTASISSASPSSTTSSSALTSSSATSHSWSYGTTTSSTSVPASTTSSSATTSSDTTTTSTETTTSGATTTSTATTTSDATTTSSPTTTTSDTTTTSSPTTTTTTSDTTTTSSATTTSDTTTTISTTTTSETTSTTVTTTTTTDTTSTTTSATATTTTAPPTPSSCGIEGYNFRGAIIQSYAASGPGINYQQCRDYCVFNSAGTVSVGFGEDTPGQFGCACYNARVADFVQSSPTGFFFWDITCPVPIVSDTSSV